MWSLIIVILPPGFDPDFGIFERNELACVEAFIPQPTIE